MTAVSTEKLAPAGRIWTAGLVAGAIAGAANLAVYFIASALGVPFNIAPPGLPAPPFPLMVVLISMVGALLGTGVLLLMPRFSQRPISTWRIVAIVALVLSFLQPLLLVSGMSGMGGMVQAGWNTILALETMHIVAGIVAIVILTRRAAA